jgi:hypothetical protein
VRAGVFRCVQWPVAIKVRNPDEAVNHAATWDGIVTAGALQMGPWAVGNARQHPSTGDNYETSISPFRPIFCAVATKYRPRRGERGLVVAAAAQEHANAGEGEGTAIGTYSSDKSRVLATGNGR